MQPNNPFTNPGGVFGGGTSSNVQQRPARTNTNGSNATGNNPFGTAGAPPTGGTDPNPFTGGSASNPAGVGNPASLGYNSFLTQYQNTNPGLGMSTYFNQQGINPYAGLGAFLNQHLGDIYGQYEAYESQNPGANWLDYLNQNVAGLSNAFAAQQNLYQRPIPPRRILG